jgi:hypothetical protein
VPERKSPRAADDVERSGSVAQAFLDPAASAAALLSETTGIKDAELSAQELARELRRQCALIRAGDTSRLDDFLLAQAHSLDVMFCALTARATHNMGEHLHAAEVYLKLALRAQSQARATVETLAMIRNPQPTTVIARQANVSHGPQQVNNGSALYPGAARFAPTEESGGPRELRSNPRAPTSPVGNDPPVEALGAVYGAADGRRQGPQFP